MSTLRQRNREIYWAWKSMKQRCQNPKCKAYHNYGARGITVCDEWQTFEPFCEWAISNGWAKGLDIDRADNENGYSPANCRWITRKDNVNNRRVTLRLCASGQSLTCREWEAQCGIPRGSLKIWAETKGKNYAESRIEDALANGYREKDYGNNRKRVLHMESGEIFESVRAAARHFGVNSGNLSRMINHYGGRTSKGHFTYEIP